LNILVNGRTDKGLVRANNEDNFYLDNKQGLFIVADGMGGHASGEIASKIAIDVIRDYFKVFKEKGVPSVGKYQEEYSELTNHMSSAVSLANKAIYEAAESNSAWRGMGTTVAAALQNGNRLSIVHVGDSRVYLIRAGTIEQLTDDHSVVYEQVKRELLTKEEAQKSEMKHLLTRALGTTADVDVDADELTLAGGDILILCTDGLNSMVSDDDILSVVASTHDPSSACEMLVNMANNNGGKDNITVIVGYMRKKCWYSFLLNIKEWFRR